MHRFLQKRIKNIPYLSIHTFHLYYRHKSGKYMHFIHRDPFLGPIVAYWKTIWFLPKACDIRKCTCIHQCQPMVFVEEKERNASLLSQYYSLVSSVCRTSYEHYIYGLKHSIHMLPTATMHILHMVHAKTKALLLRVSTTTADGILYESVSCIASTARRNSTAVHFNDKDTIWRRTIQIKNTKAAIGKWKEGKEAEIPRKYKLYT